MAYCPDCRAEYVEGITECPECEVPLVPSLPPEEEMVPIYSSTDLLEAELVKQTLAAEGIEGMVLSHEDRAFPVRGALGGYQVTVLVSRVEQARRLLAEAIDQGLFGGAGEIVEAEEGAE